MYFCQKRNNLRPLALSIFLLFTGVITCYGQGVGLVLSGGGAAGFAHIGVLRALEENNIPISYISGTSAGALVGALYACGYSPEEIESYVISEKFQLMTQGGLERSQEFLLREDEPNASLIGFSFGLDSIFNKSLPTNFIRPELLDYEMMRILGTVSASKGDNFDSLFVPFRCVASNIVAKRGDVFRSGHLNQAVRASMTFPFYINPIRINGVLYFDGGLYNNFPSDVIYQEFNPDFIIGSNVSFNALPPAEDNLISQVTNMLVTPTNFNIPCDAGILIEPKTSVQTFDFSEVKQAIESGYTTTLALIDSLKQLIPYRITSQELEIKRKKFQQSILPLNISSVETINNHKKKESYVKNSILKDGKGKVITEDVLERRYFRAYATNEIEYLYPTLSKQSDSSYRMHIDVRASKLFKAEVGGIVSSRAINTGFVQLSAMHLGKWATSLKLNSYFGKFYGSGKILLNFNLPTSYPMSVSTYLVLNRFDYFRNFATFFEEVKPSFLVQNEAFAGAQLKFPIFNNSKTVFDYRYMELEDSYYQTENFTNKDTADQTRFFGHALKFELEQNSLNRKQFATEGHLLSFKFRYVNGKEHSISGSTSPSAYDFRKNHEWLQLSGTFQSYPISTKFFSLGLTGNALLTSQSLFKNYTATILSLSAFELLADMPTFFLPEYRASQYLGGGASLIFTPKKNFDLRLDGLYFQPFKQLVILDDGGFGYTKPFKGEKLALAGSAIYHSPIGPVRFTLNYFPDQKSPFILQFTFGYILFNERATR